MCQASEDAIHECGRLRCLPSHSSSRWTLHLDPPPCLETRLSCRQLRAALLYAPLSPRPPPSSPMPSWRAARVAVFTLLPPATSYHGVALTMRRCRWCTVAVVCLYVSHPSGVVAWRGGVARSCDAVGRWRSVFSGAVERRGPSNSRCIGGLFPPCLFPLHPAFCSPQGCTFCRMPTSVAAVARSSCCGDC